MSQDAKSTELRCQDIVHERPELIQQGRGRLYLIFTLITIFPRRNRRAPPTPRGSCSADTLPITKWEWKGVPFALGLEPALAEFFDRASGGSAACLSIGEEYGSKAKNHVSTVWLCRAKYFPKVRLNEQGRRHIVISRRAKRASIPLAGLERSFLGRRGMACRVFRVVAAPGVDEEHPPRALCRRARTFISLPFER